MTLPPRATTLLLLCGPALLAGCAGRAELIPNDDPQLRKSAAQFAFSAAGQFPYPADAPAGGKAMAQSEVSYTWDRVDLINYSPAEWTDLNVWVNQKYVVHLTSLKGGSIEKPGPVLEIPFRAFYGPDGKSMPTGGLVVNKVELFRDGKLYEVPARIGE